MYLTTSKNADKQAQAIAKSIADSLPGLEFISRSKRPLEQIAKISDKKSMNEILVLMQKEGKMIILKYVQKEDFWNWENEALEISEVKAQKIKLAAPLEIVFKNERAQKIQNYLGLKSSSDSKIYEEDERTEIEIEVTKHALSISSNNQNILKANFKRVKWQKE